MPDFAIIAAPDGSMAEAMIYADLSALIAGAADFISTLAAGAIAGRGRFTIALSGGNTPKPVYERLALARVDWARVYVAFGDERCVPPDDPRSNYHMARVSLIDHVAIPERDRGRVWAASDGICSTLPEDAPLWLYDRLALMVYITPNATSSPGRRNQAPGTIRGESLAHVGADALRSASHHRQTLGG